MSPQVEREELRRTWAAVVPGLWLGGEAAPVPDEVMVVVTLEEATPELRATGVVEHRCPLVDSRWYPVDRGSLEEAIGRVHDRTRATLVRCRYGLNRSALVVGLALRRAGLEADLVVRLLMAARPDALTNPYFADLVRTYPEEPR